MSGSEDVVPVVPQKFAALFIDVPNTGHVYTKEGEPLTLSLREIAWDVLIERMLASLQVDHYIYVGNVYLFAADGRKDTIDWLSQKMKDGLGCYKRDVRIHVRAVKDIDVMMVNDMWESFYRMNIEQEIRGADPSQEITFLVAGGDGAYSYPIESLRALNGRDKVRLHTFSWGRSLSSKLSQHSDYVELLDRTGPSILRTAVHS